MFTLLVDVPCLLLTNGALFTTEGKRNPWYMESEQKLQILRDVFDIDWAQADKPVEGALSRYTRAVVTDNRVLFYEDEEFINIIMDEFPDDHPLWEFIVLE